MSIVYRVHRAGAQTRYSFSTGFAAKNQTTIVNFPSIRDRFGLAHLNQQTNISSPFVSVYKSLSHAEAVARHFAERYNEDTYVVTIDTNHLPRGPVFWAATILTGQDLSAEQKWLHEGEYLVMYRIGPQAIRDQTLVVKRDTQGWRAPGVVGGR
ncbi:hypothetical protein N0V90_005786 [Kalmusia sp. IMI 367209]|nr:hypothetical protein N0V90_005786 [Kalmusia sp. IMI 367209]